MPVTFGNFHNRIARSVHCRNRFTCLINLDGTLECTGLDDSLNNPPAGRFVQMEIGGDHACAIRADGTVACWGSNAFGQATPPAR
jgi:alpha-tubulin suppressor-like RCC1 family protein